MKTEEDIEVSVGNINVYIGVLWPIAVEPWYQPKVSASFV